MIQNASKDPPKEYIKCTCNSKDEMLIFKIINLDKFYKLKIQY